MDRAGGELAAMIDLLARRHVLAVLLCLERGPRTLRTIGRTTGARHVGAVAALHALAAAGAVRRVGGSGTWDLPPHPDSAYELTAHGRAMIAELQYLAAWAARHEHELGPHARQFRWLVPWRHPDF